MAEGARETSARVRDALLEKEERESGIPDTLIGKLEKEAAYSLRTIEDMIDSMARQKRLWLANGMNVMMANPSAPIPGTYSRERWLEIEEAFNEFEEWLNTPLAVSGVPPIVVVSRWGNPPVPPAPEEDARTQDDIINEQAK